MTQPLSGESSVLVTDLISDGFFLISTKGKLAVEQGKSCKKLKRAAQNPASPTPGYRGRIDYEHEQGVDRGGSNAGFAIGSAKTDGFLRQIVAGADETDGATFCAHQNRM